MKLSYKYHTINVSPKILIWLKSRMRWVRAAGGIVSDENGNMLLILRNGRWDLPKGKVESGETLLEAANREVEEETGIKVENGKRKTESGLPQPKDFPLSSFHFSLKTYHIFNLYGGWHLKQTSWFAMKVAGVMPPGKPQEEEGIERVEWVSKEEWHRRLQKSYGTLRTVSNKIQ